MKRIIAIILTVLLVFSLASCGADNKSSEKKNDYVVSEDIKEGSLIDGVMTDIDSEDPILTRTTASWLDTCVLYEVNVRQFTEEGTFKAFEEHLDRLKEMGINTLWFMPIHPISETERKGTLGSYYAVSDYKGVNPEFGTIEDFRALVDKAHGMGFKVLIDWVANHTGWDNAWIKEHDDWYDHDSNGKIRSPYDWTDTAQLNYENYEMRAEMIKCMQHWIEDVGIDGFRCDHATGVPASFWNAAVYKLKSVNSEIMMLAEASGSKALTGYAFDCCYNDMLYSDAVFTKGGVAISNIQNGMNVSDQYAPGSFPMNYLDNHDKNTYEGSKEWRFVDTYQPLLALTFITPGIPLIYTTDEQEYDHEIEFFEKDTVEWEDNPKYAALITALSKLKTENSALASTNRNIEFLSASNSKVFAFSRKDENNTVIYIANLYKEKVEGVDAELGFDNAEVVIHYDGTDLDTTVSKVTADDFKNKDYNAYEFYVLTSSTSNE